MMTEQEQALRRILEQATRKNRATKLYRYLKIDLEIIEQLARNVLDTNSST